MAMAIIEGIASGALLIILVLMALVCPVGLYSFIREPYKDAGDYGMIFVLSLFCILEACGIAALIIKFLESQ